MHMSHTRTVLKIAASVAGATAIALGGTGVASPSVANAATAYGSIVGTVTFATGARAPGATAYLWRWNGYSWDYLGATTTSSAGNYVFQTVQLGFYYDVTGAGQLGACSALGIPGPGLYTYSGASAVFLDNVASANAAVHLTTFVSHLAC